MYSIPSAFLEAKVCSFVGTRTAGSSSNYYISSWKTRGFTYCCTVM